ncbi:MAG: cyclic lactone autoinducer peptide [Oscillospiraceae bacterium]|jgi:cyclic lactone autoinducer peptide|nr:cyclic lactone autoinducer peptide [Oscillospiraceae bacterium]
MKNNVILKAVAALGRKSAVKAYSAASSFGCYQPKAPAAIKNLKK